MSDNRSAVVLSDGSRAWAIHTIRPPCELPITLKSALDSGTYADAVDQSTIAKSEPTLEPGLVTDDMFEYFVSGAFAGILHVKRRDDGYTASLSKTLMPAVLSDSAVKNGIMPPDGVSALPKTLEAVVPVRLRYWESVGEEALARRNALVESGLFSSNNVIKVVDGALRLCTQKLFLYVPDDTSDTEENVADVIIRVAAQYDGFDVVAPFGAGDAWFDAFVASANKSDTLLVLSADDENVIDAVCEGVLWAVPSAPWIIEHTDTSPARQVLAGVGRVFKVSSVPDSIFAASFDLASHNKVSWLDEELPDRKAVWSTAYVNDLPDSAFLYIATGGEKDSENKTRPRSLRYFPVRDKNGKLDLPHLRNALARIPQAKIPQAAKDRARAEAERLLEQAKKSDTVVLKPFAGYADFDACVQAQLDAGKDTESAKKICGALQAEYKSKQHDVRIIHKAEQEATGEERFVLGIVLEPEVKDSQGDIYSAEEIRKACHCYMEHYRGLGLMHKEDASGKMTILECYIAPCDFTVDNETVTKGTWLLANRVNDDAVWTDIQEQKLTAWSIGGSAIRQPEDSEATNE
jgi:hypothetical protein